MLIGCQQAEKVPIPEVSDLDGIYLVYRGTHSKQGLIASSYNLSNPHVSHVGILLECQGHRKVYHVIDRHKSTSALVSDHLRDFLTTEASLFHASLWKVTLTDSIFMQRLCGFVDQLRRQGVRFDYSFSENDSTSLYCSEFVYHALVQADSCAFQLPLKRVQLPPVHAQFVQSDSLFYYPVDVFQTLSQVQRVWSWTRNEP